MSGDVVLNGKFGFLPVDDGTGESVCVPLFSFMYSWIVLCDLFLFSFPHSLGFVA